MATTEREQVIHRHREAKALRIAELIWTRFDGHTDRPARLDDHMRDCPDDEWTDWARAAGKKQPSQSTKDRVIVILGNWEQHRRRWRGVADPVEYRPQNHRNMGQV